MNRTVSYIVNALMEEVLTLNTASLPIMHGIYSMIMHI